MTKPMTKPIPDPLATVSRERFAQFGLFDRAYVKKVKRHGRTTFIAYGADGTLLWRFHSRELAEATLHQQDLTMLSVH